MGSNERLSADFVFQSEGLEKTHLARDRLLEGAGDYLLDREVGDADGHEGGEDDPVQLLQQLGVRLPVEDEAPVRVSDEDHSPYEAEEKGVEVGHNHNIP